MSISLWRSYSKVKSNTCSLAAFMHSLLVRKFSDDKTNDQEFSSSTILIENGYNVHELPVIVRKLKDLSNFEAERPSEKPKSGNDSLSYHLIQAEFKQCVDLRDVFTLITKCTKITPNIALGAIERIYDLEKEPTSVIIGGKNVQMNFAKGAILDKLLKVVTQTEDTQTILNVLKTISTIMDPYKYKFCDELLIRVIDNKLTIEQLCEFATFLIINSADEKYSETIDKLWVGFIEREKEMNGRNIAQIFALLPGFKASKRTILYILEQKLSELWCDINVSAMQDILTIIIQEKYFSLQSFVVFGRWLNTNIHKLDEDSLLDVITKLTRLNYTDDQVEKAVEKYMKYKSSKIQSYVLLVGILNYCMQFKIRNEHILNECSGYFLMNGKSVPQSFLKSFIYPFGLLYFNSNDKFWFLTEDIVLENIDRISIDDICAIVLASIYNEKYPLTVISKIFSPEFLAKVDRKDAMKKLHLIDTALSLECKDYCGPLLPKDQWINPVLQDKRIKNIIDKIKGDFEAITGGKDKLSVGVSVPNYCSDETYLIDVMLHPSGLGSNMFNWKSKTMRNNNIAILIHLPDHYCSNNEHLIGPQIMKRKHLRILGMKVVSLKYSLLSQFYTSHNTSALRRYIIESIENAEPCIEI